MSEDAKRKIAELLLSSLPSTPVDTFQRNYARSETMPFGTNSIAALGQMIDPLGLTPKQMNQNNDMRPALLQYAIRSNPALASLPSAENPGAAIAQRNSLGEDLNSVRIKFSNWLNAQRGQELSPQDRVTQGFIDVRNPNSWF